MPEGSDKTMIIEMIENVYVKGRNKLSKYQHRHFHPMGPFEVRNPPLFIAKLVV